MLNCRSIIAVVLRKLTILISIWAATGYLFIPLLVLIYPRAVDIVIFCPQFARLICGNLTNVANYGLDPAQATYHQVRTGDGNLLGTWLIRPPPGIETRGQVIIFLEGNGGYRGVSHQVSRYKVLANAGFDVVSFDYRGFGDSSCMVYADCEPSELGLTLDSHTIYEWTLDKVAVKKGGKSVIIWGHSLGGGVAANLAKNLCELGNCTSVGGLVLESSFSDLKEAAVLHPFAWPFRLFEPSLRAVTTALESRYLIFNNTKALTRVRLPVLMLHAEDDATVPAKLSRRAFDIATRVRPTDWPAIEYKLFDARHGYGHQWLHTDSEFLPVLLNFLTKHAIL